MSIVLKGARLVDHRGAQTADLLIENGKIAKIGQNLTGDTVLSLAGKVVLPSFVDLHTHFRDPGFTYKEDLESGALSALKGGFTIVNAMANTRPVCDSADIYQDIIGRAKTLDLVDFSQTVAVSHDLKGETLVDYAALPQSAYVLSDDGKDLLSSEMMYRALQKAKAAGKLIMVHAEEPVISAFDYRTAEDLITLRDLYLAKRLDARIHFSHVSTIDAIEAIAQAKKEGVKVSCEVTPHHIYFSDMDYRVNPPIRKEEDRLALIRAIKDGTVDAIASDHAPHSKEDKEKGAPGMIGFETSFAVCYTTLVKHAGLSLEKLSYIMSKRPAEILGRRHGEISEGEDANLVIVDLTKEFVLREEEIVSKSKNSPFIGEKLYGVVEMTIRNGRIMYGGL